MKGNPLLATVERCPITVRELSMATFISLVRGDASSGYTAFAPDFSGFTVQGTTLDHVLAKVREGLSLHIERLLENGEIIPVPTTVDAIKYGEALLLFAVEMPDDISDLRVDLAIPALALARIDSLAARTGLTRASLFVSAVDRWIFQETLPRQGMRERSTDPSLFDFITPPELKMEPEIAVEQSEIDPANNIDLEGSVDNITQELERLLEQSSHPQPAPGGGKES
jgi:predicted RNase H-like HicB family nuclease